MGYFKEIWQFASAIKETMQKGNLDDAQIHALMEQLKAIEHTAQTFESNWNGPKEEHPMVVWSLKYWQNALSEIISKGNKKRKIAQLAKLHMDVSDFLYAHGGRFGYINKSVANSHEMWSAGPDDVAFEAKFAQKQ